MRKVVFLLAVVAAFVLAGRATDAWAWPCDFLTGGGWIERDTGAKANFGVGGGCKHGSPTWGHLNYIDHGTGLHVHWTSITGYFEVETRGGERDRDPKRRGTRIICGTAWTNQFGPVNFSVKAKDEGEPGRDDEFIIRLSKSILGFETIVYTTEGDSDHTLGGPGPGGGNIQLHKPNPSTTGSFGGSCPAGFPANG